MRSRVTVIRELRPSDRTHYRINCLPQQAGLYDGFPSIQPTPFALGISTKPQPVYIQQLTTQTGGILCRSSAQSRRFQTSPDTLTWRAPGISAIYPPSLALIGPTGILPPLFLQNSSASLKFLRHQMPSHSRPSRVSSAAARKGPESLPEEKRPLAGASKPYLQRGDRKTTGI